MKQNQMGVVEASPLIQRKWRPSAHQVVGKGVVRVFPKDGAEAAKDPV